MNTYYYEPCFCVTQRVRLFLPGVSVDGCNSAGRNYWETKNSIKKLLWIGNWRFLPDRQGLRDSFSSCFHPASRRSRNDNRWNKSMRHCVSVSSWKRDGMWSDVSRMWVKIWEKRSNFEARSANVIDNSWPNRTMFLGHACPECKLFVPDWTGTWRGTLDRLFQTVSI